MTQSSIGLCVACSWARRVESGRGSTFLRCGRYDEDRRFPKYPQLPVTSCIGFDPPPPELADELLELRRPEPQQTQQEDA